jgi:hypothetical protein
MASMVCRLRYSPLCKKKTASFLTCRIIRDCRPQKLNLNQPVIVHFWRWLEVILVEAGGIEPPSEGPGR